MRRRRPHALSNAAARDVVRRLDAAEAERAQHPLARLAGRLGDLSGRELKTLRPIVVARDAAAGLTPEDVAVLEGMDARARLRRGYGLTRDGVDVGGGLEGMTHVVAPTLGLDVRVGGGGASVAGPAACVEGLRLGRCECLEVVLDWTWREPLPAEEFFELSREVHAFAQRLEREGRRRVEEANALRARERQAAAALEAEARERQREAGKQHGRGQLPPMSEEPISEGEATEKAAELVGVGRSTVAAAKQKAEREAEQDRLFPRAPGALAWRSQRSRGSESWTAGILEREF